jgi:hypothetical protein
VAGRELAAAQALVGRLDLDLGVGEAQLGGGGRLDDVVAGLGVASLGPLAGVVDPLAGEASGEGGRADPRPEGASHPALIGGRHVAVHGEAAQRDPERGALLEVDVEVGLLVVATADQRELGLAAQVALVEHVALEALDLVGLPLGAGGVVGGADRGARGAAGGLRARAVAVGEGAGAGGDAELALDVALRQREVAADADATDAAAGLDGDGELAGVLGGEARAVAELLELGADGRGVEVAGLEAEDLAQPDVAVAAEEATFDAQAVDVGEQDPALLVLERGACDQLLQLRAGRHQHEDVALVGGLLELVVQEAGVAALQGDGAGGPAEVGLALARAEDEALLLEAVEHRVDQAHRIGGAFEASAAADVGGSDGLAGGGAVGGVVGGVGEVGGRVDLLGRGELVVRGRLRCGVAGERGSEGGRVDLVGAVGLGLVGLGGRGRRRDAPRRGEGRTREGEDGEPDEHGEQPGDAGDAGHASGAGHAGAVPRVRASAGWGADSQGAVRAIAGGGGRR